MRSIGVFEAKTHLSELLADAERGETIVITRKGEPVAELGPIRASADARARARRAYEMLARVAEDVERHGGPVSHEQIKEWINEGRP
jgi:prevent-host-death family protein